MCEVPVPTFQFVGAKRGEDETISPVIHQQDIIAADKDIAVQIARDIFLNLANPDVDIAWLVDEYKEIVWIVTAEDV